jgi:hypothetical protein
VRRVLHRRTQFVGNAADSEVSDCHTASLHYPVSVSGTPVLIKGHQSVIFVRNQLTTCHQVESFRVLLRRRGCTVLTYLSS